MPHPIRISVRAAPAVIAWHTPKIQSGEPLAEVGVNTSTFHLPNAVDDAGMPTQALREWIIQAIRHAIRQDELRRWITWPDLSVTAFVEPDLTPHHRPAVPTIVEPA